MREQVIENLVDPYIWKDLKYKSENIDKLLQWAMQKQTKMVCDKYSNISNTVKHLKNLMLEFSKKADNLEKSLIASTRIEQKKLQISYYQDRIKSCLDSSKNIQNEISEKNKNISEKQTEANRLKRALMRLKTQNIKLNMKIQQTQQQYWTTQEKENIRLEKQRRRLKKQQDRKMITCTVFRKDSALQKENIRVELELFEKIDKIKQLRVFIEECFEVCREKLKKQEKKSNMYGLAGSMLFKLESKDDSSLPKLNKFNDSKLIVYDILRQKYRKHIKNETKKHEKLNISLDQFMKFGPLQIIGLIQLKGGLKTIINKKCTTAQMEEVKL